MTPTNKEVMEATTELQNAMLESVKADRAEVDIKLAKQKAHKRLSMARDVVRALTFSQ